MDEQTLITALATRIAVLEDALSTLESAAVGIADHARHYSDQDVVIPGQGAPDDPAYPVKGWELRALDDAWHKAQDALFPERAAEAYALLAAS